MLRPARASTALTLSLGLAVLLAACAQPPPRDAGGPSAPGAQPARGPKTLTLGVQRGMPSFSPYTGFSVSTSASSITQMVTDGLGYQDDEGIFHPLMAVELPSIEKGTWRVFDDGTMETTWHMRPNLKWHDGVPLTAEDYAFGFMLEHDRELPKAPSPAVLAQTAIATPDPLTVVITWSTLFVDAGTTTVAIFQGTGGGSTLPRHLLEETYQRDKNAFVNSSFFTTDFVSSGPYKLARWEPGADMELVPFE